jgi:hypothetical protein
MTPSGHWDNSERAGSAEPCRAVRRGGAGAAGLGLSNAHIARKKKEERPRYLAQVWDGGCLLQVRDTETQSPPGGGVRGEVQGFSAASRRRLMYYLDSLDRRKLSVPLFVTLTYPGADWERFGGRKEEVKRHLDAFNHWLAYHYPQSSAIWRLEFQKRGAPHLHLLVFGVEFIDCYILAREWFRVVGSGQASHLLAGTQVKACESWGEATAYVAKYMAKLESFEDSGVPIHSRPGRVWGVWRRPLLPREPVIYGLDRKEYVALRRIMRGLCKSKGYRLRAQGSFSAFLSSEAGHRALAFVGAEVRLTEEQSRWRSESPESYSRSEVQAEGEE